MHDRKVWHLSGTRAVIKNKPLFGKFIVFENKRLQGAEITHRTEICIFFFAG